MPHLALLLTNMKAVQICALEHPDAHEAAISYATDSETLVELLNAAMATELICMLRYRRHHFVASGIHSQSIAQKFLDHANEALGHADRLAARIVKLGGAPEFSPDGLTIRSRAGYGDGGTLSSMIRENLLAKHLAIDHYRSLIQHLGIRDATTRSLLEDILTVEERHSDELAEQLVALHIRRHVAWPSSSAVVDHSVS